jgi:FAD/FMN-containing dehydrogenase/Fe-S oxidoreductase
MQGELHYDDLLRSIYATDASVYRELPMAVAYPKNDEDIIALIQFANAENASLIPRAAGTSLAGQCVGSGIVVDTSRYYTDILELNTEENWVRVQPGVIRDELNAYLKPHGLWFGPNTSTANRATIGGMVGNNSSGTTSIKYGVTRDHVLEINAVLSDGSRVLFSELDNESLQQKTRQNSLEGRIYKHLIQELSDTDTQLRIAGEFPKAEIHRRNTGYAVDMLLHQQPFSPEGNSFNLCSLLSGSEGTLAFTTEIKLRVLPLPPPHERLIAAHFNSIDESLRATQIVMRFDPDACELMDKTILDCTKSNREQSRNRSFVEGDPAALLLVQFNSNRAFDVDEVCEKAIEKMRSSGLGYAFPKLENGDIRKAWELRKAGLGLLANLPGDAKGVACIEDTAVTVDDLPDYISAFAAMMARYKQEAVYYAHAGAGELHLRPILDLKKSEDVTLFREITQSTAELVKKYGGSLSGEHGDGRVRAAFIQLMLGEENYALLKRIKNIWDPNNILNPGKIIDAAPMDESLRYEIDREEPDIETIFNYQEEGGFLRAAEKCNGSGDCRKISGGTMCPSYKATRNEKDTTRARANALREFLTRDWRSENPFAHQELKEVMDLCISCKGCTIDCPSNVDMSTMKAEFLYQYQRTNGVPFRSKMLARNARMNGWMSHIAPLSNALMNAPFIGRMVKQGLGVAKERQLPHVHRPLDKWFRKQNFTGLHANGSVYFFNDEFTRYLDTEIGKTAIRLLHHLGYEVRFVDHAESGRAHLSKGLLPEAQLLARENVDLFKHLISEKTPLVGIEPSTILSFRDEYPKLVQPEERVVAMELSKHALLLDEFLYSEMMAGKIKAGQFDNTERIIKLHGHCHQKALSDIGQTAHLLALPAGHSVEVIPSGCCGMAGSFGYEKEHYGISMRIGEDVLFPAVRKSPVKAIIAAPGTSCRHQIADGTGRKALHPVEILFAALKR